MTNEQIAKMMGCSVEQVQAQHARNARMLSVMHDKAKETGGKVNGYTADQLRAMQSAAHARAMGA